MADATISQWSIECLDPDGSSNAFMASNDLISTSVPPDLGEVADFLTVGQTLRLSLLVDLTGTYPDGTNCELDGAIVRYNPSLFSDVYAPFFPAFSWPAGGYSVQFPNSPSGVLGTWPMPLANFGVNTLCNENGTVTIEAISSVQFEIVHVFQMTADLRGYITGAFLENKFRLTKSSFVNREEFDVSIDSVYSVQRSLNVYIGVKKGSNVVYAPELMVLSDANYFDRSVDPDHPVIGFSSQIELASAPGVAISELSSFEDNILHIEVDETGFDPSGTLYPSTQNIFTLLMFVRNHENNNSTYSDDYELAQSRIIHAPPPDTSQVAGAMYNPSEYSTSGSKIILDIHIKASELDPSKTYEFFVLTDLLSPITGKAWQQVNRTGTLKASLYPTPLVFSLDGLIWSRNGQSGEAFTNRIGERVTSTFVAAIDEYNAASIVAANGAFDDFAHDCVKVEIQIIDNSNGDIIFKHFMSRLPDVSFPINDAYIGFTETVTDMNFYLKEFRVPYTNFQDLQNWLGGSYTFKWSLYFHYTYPVQFFVRYDFDCVLTPLGYENQEPTPAVYDVKFWNITTGLPLANWCDEQSCLVTAKVDFAVIGVSASDVWIEARVDKFPLGVELFSEGASHEHDGECHAIAEPYVIFACLLSDLISDLTEHPVDDTVQFILDLSELNFGEKYRIYVHAYLI